MRTFILLSAMPGSGKSTWANAYKQSHENVIIVSSDDIREMLTGDAGNVSEDKKVWPEYLRQIKEASKIDGITVIGDSTNLSNHFRIYYADVARPLYDKLVLINFDVPYEVCQQRNISRYPGRVVPDFAMELLRKEYEKPSEEALERYDEVYEVDESGSTKRNK